MTRIPSTRKSARDAGPHDFVTMHVNGVRYLDKAPLPYWITAAGYSILGVSEFSARLPLSLFALASLFTVFWLGREIAGEQAGFFSGLVLGTAIGPYIYTRFEIPDIMVGFWLILTVIFSGGFSIRRILRGGCAGHSR